MAADAAYPRPEALDALRARLAPQERCVLFAFLGGNLVALVVGAEEARIVRLGARAEVEALVAAVHASAEGDRAGEPDGLLDALGAAVLGRLALPAGVTRLLVVPDGELALAPFPALAGGRDVVLLPSATSHALLAARGTGLRGAGVLAVGDPDCAASGLPALPGTRAEAEAVGTTVLLGADATEPGLRAALCSRPRWRSVHLACHGLVDDARPFDSALVLTPSDGDDGQLTVLDVLGTPFPADLVSLSACDGGRGAVLRGEGLLGLSRALLLAGAPRVLCSLWDVDDDATRAFMERFYALWAPKDGGPGIAPSAALREAQAHVRSRKRWAHPAYWAAWVLWGLPQ